MMMTPTRIRTLLAIAFGCALAAWGALRLVYANLPPLPWTGVPALLVLTVAEIWAGWSVRARLRGRRGGMRIQPIAIARLAALAKASSLAASIVGGLALGFEVFVVQSLSKPAYRADAWASGATLAAAITLAAAALYLEHGCRVPPPRDEPETQMQPRGQDTA